VIDPKSSLEPSLVALERMYLSLIFHLRVQIMFDALRDVPDSKVQRNVIQAMHDILDKRETALCP